MKMSIYKYAKNMTMDFNDLLAQVIVVVGEQQGMKTAGSALFDLLTTSKISSKRYSTMVTKKTCI